MRSKGIQQFHQNDGRYNDVGNWILSISTVNNTRWKKWTVTRWITRDSFFCLFTLAGTWMYYQLSHWHKWKVGLNIMHFDRYIHKRISSFINFSFFFFFFCTKKKKITQGEEDICMTTLNFPTWPSFYWNNFYISIVL